MATKGNKAFYENYKGFSDLGEDKGVLRTDRGVSRTKSLFVEFERDCGFKFKPTYTLREDEREDYPSAYKIYITSIDEADAAMRLVGSLTHWRKLMGLKWFMNGIPSHGHTGLLAWRKDMKARDDTTAKRILLEAAGLGNVTAAKALKAYALEDDSAGQKAKDNQTTSADSYDDKVVDFQRELDKL